MYHKSLIEMKLSRHEFFFHPLNPPALSTTSYLCEFPCNNLILIASCSVDAYTEVSAIGDFVPAHAISFCHINRDFGD
jgi:hypothetical protein